MKIIIVSEVKKVKVKNYLKKKKKYMYYIAFLFILVQWIMVIIIVSQKILKIKYILNIMILR